MSAKEKSKITSFFKPKSNNDKETKEKGAKQDIENSSIMANSNDQVL